jgi:hypothetical protein
VIDQVDRRGSSCPVLFTWNGREYEFITDAIGPAVVGHWVAPGERNVPDPNEYLKVRGDQLVAKNGRFSLKFTEPMEEVIYLDQVRLYAIDHPADADIFPHEYFAALAPQPPDQVFVSRNLRLPLGAWDHNGRDVMPALREADRRYVDGFRNAPFKGFAELHSLELDLGPLPAGGPVRLVIDGFTDYFTATSTFAAHQADVTAIVPYLEVQLADGTWKRVSDDIGFPAGLYRTMTADLTGLLPPGTRRIRISTNLKVYWDRVLVDTTPVGAVPSRRTEAPLVDASLAFRGFQREIPGQPGSRPALRLRPGEPLRPVGAASRLLHALRRRVAAAVGRGRPLRHLRRRRRGGARVRRHRPAARAGGLEARLRRVLPRLREGHGLLRRARTDGDAAAVRDDGDVSVPRHPPLPRAEPRVPARVEHARGAEGELAELSGGVQGLAASCKLQAASGSRVTHLTACRLPLAACS